MNRPLVVVLEFGHELGFDLRAIFAGLLAHPSKQFLAFDAVRVAGVVARAGDPRSSALAAVHDENVEVEAGEIDRRGQPRRAAADDQAIEEMFVHARQSARPESGSGPCSNRAVYT